MYNLLRFVKQYQFILLFVIIESFSIFLLVSNNNYQRVKLLEATTEYTSAFYKYSNNLIDYFRLKKTNQYLIDENAKLHSLIRSQTFDIDTMLNVKNNFSYHGAKVINNSISKRNNHLTLNKGRKHGLTKGMGVVTSKGVIGIIKSTSKNYSIAISTLHRESAISIKLKNSNQHGILKWNGLNYRIGTITNFPSHILINKNDTIITSSHSMKFPEGINIGTVSKFSVESDGYYIVEVNFFEDFNKLDFVYAVCSKNEEQKKLEKTINNE